MRAASATGGRAARAVGRPGDVCEHERGSAVVGHGLAGGGDGGSGGGGLAITTTVARAHNGGAL